MPAFQWGWFQLCIGSIGFDSTKSMISILREGHLYLLILLETMGGFLPPDWSLSPTKSMAFMPGTP